MGSYEKLHIFFFPFMAPGHMIPMADMAKLFAMRGVKSTLLVTPPDAPSVSISIERTQKLGFDINITIIKLPLEEVGLSEDFDNLKSVKSPEMLEKFQRAVRMLDKPLARLIKEIRPDCVISDLFFPWTNDVAAKCGIPRLVFHGTGYFALCAAESIELFRPYEDVSNDMEPFLIPNFPGDITMTRAQLPEFVVRETEVTKIFNEVKDSELASYGVVINSFYELEPAYADHYTNVLGKRSWGIGPVSIMCNMEERGSMDGHEALKWLDSKEPDSVIYICFGSSTNFTPHQLHEIAAGLEASGQPFVWVVNKDEEWLPQGYEERMRDKGLIVRGWAPQVSILEHKSVGSFVTHCGWNSTLEGISAGVNIVTWPVGAEQFYNEKLVTQVLRIGIPVGAKKWAMMVGDDQVKSMMVEKAVKRVMVGEEGEEMRLKARELSKMVKEAVEEGGSSYLAMTSLLEELLSKKNYQ